MSRKGILQRKMGSASMSAVEVLMVCKKGEVPSPQRILSLGIRVIIAERLGNSEKPQAYQRTEKVFDGTRT
eukprot:snap_masked-scaffold_7-processed-gene-6.19-mRNA-1 protein AED:1.00 eAED:1.00 QI:0/-1/0/0/-1/1/1/0/70